VEKQREQGQKRAFESLSCARDIFYWIDHRDPCYVHCLHPTRGIVPLDLYPWQRKELREWQRGQHTILNKGRGIGFSTAAATFAYWRIVFHHDPLWLFGSRRGLDAQELLEKAWVIFDHTPEWMRPAVSEARSTTLSLIHAPSRIVSLSSNPSFGRNFHATGVVLDEWAYLPFDEKMWRSLQPTLEHGGQLIGGSTPNGVGNTFHRIYAASKSGELDFRYAEYLYTQVPGHDEEWLKAEAEKKGLSKEDIAQEHLCQFLQSGRPVYEQGDIERAFRENRSYPVTKGPRRGFHLIATDPAEGTATGDFTSVTVFDIRTGDAVYHEKFRKPITGGIERLAYLLMVFPGVLAVEVNAVGIAYVAAFPRCLKIRTTSGKNEKFTQGIWLVPKKNLIHGLVRELEESEHKLCGDAVKDELLVYQYRDNNTTAAPSGYNDDCVMSTAIGRWVLRKGLVKVPKRALRTLPTINAAFDSFLGGRAEGALEMFDRRERERKKEEEKYVSD